MVLSLTDEAQYAQENEGSNKLGAPEYTVGPSKMGPDTFFEAVSGTGFTF